VLQQLWRLAVCPDRLPAAPYWFQVPAPNWDQLPPAGEPPARQGAPRRRVRQPLPSLLPSSPRLGEGGSTTEAGATIEAAGRSGGGRSSAAMAAMAAAEEEEYEAVLCVKPAVHVYRVPPRASNRGYRWGLPRLGLRGVCTSCHGAAWGLPPPARELGPAVGQRGLPLTGCLCPTPRVGASPSPGGWGAPLPSLRSRA